MAQAKSTPSSWRLRFVTWERVYTINDFFHRPRLGVADVFGRPHIYALAFNTLRDDYEDFFLVSPIAPDVLTLVLEDRDIELRWCRAFYDRGEVPAETQIEKTLPEDRKRRGEIMLLIGARLRIDPTNCRKLRAEFRNIRKYDSEVQWYEVAII